jgi:tetratricopeptide (TPR) repeat protein
MVVKWFRLGAAVALVSGCATARVAAPATSFPVINVPPTVITPKDDETLAQAFERAHAMLVEGKFAEAGELFDRVAREDAGGAIAPLASFNAGVAWEQAGQREAALERFRSAADRHPEGDVGKWACLRASRIQAYLEQWSPLSATSDLLLSRADLTDIERLEALGAKALAVVEAGDPEAAERFIAKGRDIIESLRLGEGGKLPLEVAQIHFALGEVRRLRGEAIVFVPVPANFADALERRCQLLLDAQSAYSDAMRSYDAHWAAMSGYRVGELYQKLHRDVMSIPPPTTAATTADKRLFEGAMRLRYRVLLEKGLKMMEHTIMIGERTGEASAWIERARSAKRDLELALNEQKERLAKLPYTEKELQKALDDLAARSKP